jgi:hypothetical protein
VRRFQVVRVGSSTKRAAAAILGGYPSKRIADKCARLYRPATLVALRIGLETYETAALPLSYVGADQVLVLSRTSAIRPRAIALEILLDALAQRLNS